MGWDCLFRRRGGMGPSRGAVPMVYDGVAHGTMGMVHSFAWPGKLCLAVGIDDSTQGPSRVTSRIGDGNGPFRCRAGSLLICILDFIFLWLVQASSKVGSRSIRKPGCVAADFSDEESKEKLIDPIHSRSDPYPRRI